MIIIFVQIFNRRISIFKQLVFKKYCPKWKLDNIINQLIYRYQNYRMDSWKSDEASEDRKSQLKQKTNSFASLNKKYKKISQMNALIVQKLSIIVNGYYESMDKLQKYYQQIQNLINYNKRLISILQQFQAQEDRLIKRLKRMQEINIQYMKQYCQVKGRQFKAPNLPQQKSIFAQVNLKRLHEQMPQIEAPKVDTNYQNELKNILVNFYLNKQQILYENVLDEIKNQEQNQFTNGQGQKQLKKLMQIKQMVEQYNKQLQQNKQEKIFQLMKLRTQIRRKVQDYYDNSGNNMLKEKFNDVSINQENRSQLMEKQQRSINSQQKFLPNQSKINLGQGTMRQKKSKLKPDYGKQQQFVNKILNLHAKTQQINQEIILHYLDQQKKNRSSIKKSQIQIQQELQKKYQQLVIQCKQKKQLMDQISKNNQQLRKQLVLSNIKLEQKQQFLTLELENKQNEVQKQNKEIAKLKQELENKQLVKQLHQKITILQIQINEALRLKQSKQNQITVLLEKIKQIQVQYEQYVQKMRQQFNKANNDKKVVQNLAIKVYQALQIVAGMDFNKKVKDKLISTKAHLEKYIDEYQKKMQWNIMKQAPAFFKNLSLIQNMSQNSILSQSDLQDQRINRLKAKNSYSFDLKNASKIKRFMMNKNMQIKNENNSFKLQKIVQISMIQNRPDGSLDLSNELRQQKNQNDQYNNLRNLYQQALQCLQMQQKKSKKIELEYQRYVQKILNKQKEDPDKFSLQNQLVYLTRLAIEQKETIETQRKQYNQIFKNYHQGFKSQMQESLKSLRMQSFDAKSQKKFFQ